MGKSGCENPEAARLLSLSLTSLRVGIVQPRTDVACRLLMLWRWLDSAAGGLLCSMVNAVLGSRCFAACRWASAA